MPQALFVIAATALGLAFGSFANVLIWRFPRGESVSNPPSHCPNCDTPIAPRDNIPLLSWLLLKGHCRSCSTPISARYPLVELLGGLLWLFAALAFGPSVRAVFAMAFLYILLVLSFIDLDTMRLPNQIVGVLAVVGLLGAVFAQLSGVAAVPLLDFSGRLESPLAGALIGGLVSGGVVFAVAVAYRLLRGKTGIGMGDVKLLGAIGVFLGPYALLCYFFASLIGAVVSLLAAARDPEMLKSRFPFGPFLAAGAVVVVFVGPRLWFAYLSLVGLKGL